MKDFQKTDWKIYSRPPFYQQWLCRDDTLGLATFGDKGLAEFDDQVLSLKDQWDFDNVKGYFLDRIGKLLSESRNGNTDEYYRILLRLRMLLNTNNGSIPSIIKAIKFIYSSEVVHIVPNYPAGLIIKHDGEGTQGLNFNKLLSEIIPAGVGYHTTELFYYSETISISDMLWIVIHRKDFESFQSIKYNGTIKYDGHTVNEKILVRYRYNRQLKYNGEHSYSGIKLIDNPYFPKVPFKYFSGVFDKFTMGIEDRSSVDTAEMADNAITGFRKLRYYNGAHTHNGATKYDSTVFIPLALT